MEQDALKATKNSQYLAVGGAPLSGSESKTKLILKLQLNNSQNILMGLQTPL